MTTQEINGNPRSSDTRAVLLERARLRDDGLRSLIRMWELFATACETNSAEYEQRGLGDDSYRERAIAQSVRWCMEGLRKELDR